MMYPAVVSSLLLACVLTSSTAAIVPRIRPKRDTSIPSQVSLYLGAGDISTIPLKDEAAGYTLYSVPYVSVDSPQPQKLDSFETDVALSKVINLLYDRKGQDLGEKLNGTGVKGQIQLAVQNASAAITFAGKPEGMLYLEMADHDVAAHHA